MVIDPKIEQLFGEGIIKFNETLLRHEQIRQHHLLYEEWTMENDLFTPTLKAKRKSIQERYSREIEDMYVEGSS